MVALCGSMWRGMSDHADSTQRELARSAVGEAMAAAGCRCPPDTWQMAHLEPELEKALSSRPVKDIGYAFLLQALRLERMHDQPGAVFEEGQEPRGRGGPRWAGQGSTAGQQLSAEHPRFAACDTQMLFEPVARGGCGAPFKLVLTECGVVAAGNMSKPAAQGSEAVAAQGKWICTYAEARARDARLPDDAEVSKAWADTIEWLRHHGVEAPRPERVRQTRTAGEVRDQASAPRGRVQPTVNMEAAAAFMEGARREAAGEWETCVEHDVDIYSRLLNKAVGKLPTPRAAEWDVGQLTFLQAADGARLVVVGQDGELHEGGERRWMRRSHDDLGREHAVGAD